MSLECGSWSRVDCTEALMVVLGALMAVFRIFEAGLNASKAALDSRAGPKGAGCAQSSEGFA